MRKSSRLFLITAVQAALFLALFVHASSRTQAELPAIAERGRLAARLGLTDLCLFTEARYTRHPSQADLHAPFQDHPLSLEHFPSGSLLAPPVARTGALP